MLPAASQPPYLTKVQGTAPGLVNLAKSARVRLEKHGLAEQRAAIYLVLDRSGSMRPFYRDGSMQHLAEQALGLSVNLDDDGVVPVVFFSTGVDGIADLSLDSYEDRIGALHDSMGRLGRTNYHVAMQAVIDHYVQTGSKDPALVLFQTDGAPTSRRAAEELLCSAAQLPIFWQFIGFGNDEFRFLRKLDELPVPAKRCVDNAGFFAAGPHPRALSDDEVYEGITAEFPSWLRAARTAGVLA